MSIISNDLATLLDREASRINSPDFIGSDPVQFPRRFDSLPDIEIAALLSATIAWGNRKMICNNCRKMLELMDYQPFSYVADRGYEDITERFNIHRTFFSDDFTYYLRGLNRIYSKFGSIDNFAFSQKIADSPMPAWELTRLLNHEFQAANNGAVNHRCFPGNIDKTALKRINMALRWLIRDDGIVDMGVWRSLKPAQLFIPLDVHVGNTARTLGILTRKSNDRKAVAELTAALRELRPDDPTLYDYALFGIGIGAKYTDTNLPI